MNTPFESLDIFAARSDEATRNGAQAFGRLLDIAENGNSGQTPRVARFLAAVHNGLVYPFDPFEMRMVDIAISDDMLQCLDALRWGRFDLHDLIVDGDARMRAVLRRWRLSYASFNHPDPAAIGWSEVGL